LSHTEFPHVLIVDDKGKVVLNGKVEKGIVEKLLNKNFESASKEIEKKEQKDLEKEYYLLKKEITKEDFLKKFEVLS